MIKLSLGCGIHVQKGFINVDLYEEKDLKEHKGFFKNAVWEKGGKYIKSDIRHLPFKDNYADYVELFEVLEHMPFRDVIPTLKEIYRVMKPKAMLRLHVPNFDALVRDWLEVVCSNFNVNEYVNVMETIYGNQRALGEFHQTPFNPPFMNFCLSQAGFGKGNMFKVLKYGSFPKFGSEKFDPKQQARYEVLYVEVIK
jgi:predicted SAM-dependent methyltransferase